MTAEEPLPVVVQPPNIRGLETGVRHIHGHEGDQPAVARPSNTGGLKVLFPGIGGLVAFRDLQVAHDPLRSLPILRVPAPAELADERLLYLIENVRLEGGGGRFLGYVATCTSTYPLSCKLLETYLKVL